MAPKENELSVRRPAFVEVTPDSFVQKERSLEPLDSCLTIELNGIKLIINEATSDSLIRRVCGVLINA